MGEKRPCGCLYDGYTVADDCAYHGNMRISMTDAYGQIEEMKELLRDCTASIEFDDARLDYVTVQISRRALDDVRSLLKGGPKS